MIRKRFSVSALFLPSVSLLAVLAVCVSSVQAAERTALSLNGIWQIESQIKRIDGSSISTTEIDQTVKRLMKSAEVTGAAIAVLNDGKVVYTRAYGFRDKEKNLPLTTDSVMSGASLTKAAFAFLVLELVDDGKLDLDKPIQQYLAKPLPEYSRYADLAADDRYKKITARMLLSHSAGFPNWRAFEDDRKLHIHFDPGLRYAYSGEGIDLLQLVVEVITNQSVGELMQDRIFTPLDMTRTSMTWQSRFESDFANGYDEYGRLLGPQKRQNPDAAGSLLTTVSDYARLVAAISNGKLFSAKSRAQLLSPQIRIHSKHQFPSLANELSADNDLINLSYGLGWGLYTSPTELPSSRKVMTTAGGTMSSASKNPSPESSSSPTAATAKASLNIFSKQFSRTPSRPSSGKATRPTTNFLRDPRSQNTHASRSTENSSTAMQAVTVNCRISSSLSAAPATISRFRRTTNLPKISSPNPKPISTPPQATTPSLSNPRTATSLASSSISATATSPSTASTNALSAFRPS